MKKKLLALATLVTLLASTSSARADGKLYSINPLIKQRAQPLGTGSAYLKSKVKTVFSEAALGKKYLFWSVIEACTDNRFMIGSASDPILVRFQPGQTSVDMVEDESHIYPDLAGAPIKVVERFPARETTEGVELDLAGGVRVSSEGGVRSSTGAGEIVGFTVGEDTITWSQVQLLSGEGGNLPSSMTVGVRFWLKEVKESEFQPKDYSEEEEETLGYFTIEPRLKKEDSGKTEKTKRITRWDSSKPIQVVLHPSVPEDLKAAHRDGALTWNNAFEKAVGRPVVEVTDGTDPSVLPGSPDKIVLYYYDYDLPNTGGILAIGPSLAHPITGEIIAGHVLVFGGTLNRLLNDFQEEGAWAKENFPANEARPEPFQLILPGGGVLPFNPEQGFPANPTAIEDARQFSEASGTDKTALLDRIVRELMPHEVGHTLGLRHNFMGSADHEHLREGQVTTTVMDYTIYFNGNTVPGAYDDAVIAFGYGGKPASDFKDLLYGEDFRKLLDPRANVFDQGDPLAFYKARFDHYQKLRTNEELFKKREHYGGQVQGSVEGLMKIASLGDPQRRLEAYAFMMEIISGQKQVAPVEGMADEDIAKLFAFNEMERMVTLNAMVQAGPIPEAVEEGLTFQPLLEPQAKLGARVLSLIAGGQDQSASFDMRRAAIGGLHAMGRIEAQTALEATVDLLKANQQLAEDAGTEKELMLIAQRALQNFRFRANNH